VRAHANGEGTEKSGGGKVKGDYHSSFAAVVTLATFLLDFLEECLTPPLIVWHTKQPIGRHIGRLVTPQLGVTH